MKTQTVVAVVEGSDALTELVIHLICQSCWFDVEPQPDDKWFVEVKQDVAHVAFGSSVKTFGHERVFH